MAFFWLRCKISSRCSEKFQGLSSFACAFQRNKLKCSSPHSVEASAAHIQTIHHTNQQSSHSLYHLPCASVYKSEFSPITHLSNCYCVPLKNRGVSPWLSSSQLNPIVRNHLPQVDESIPHPPQRSIDGNSRFICDLLETQITHNPHLHHGLLFFR